MKNKFIIIYIIFSTIIFAVILFAKSDLDILDDEKIKLKKERVELLDEQKMMANEIERLNNMNRLLKFKYNKVIEEIETAPNHNNFNDAIGDFFNS